MSFTASSNNIKITNSNGVTIFDTATPMPHITNTITTSVTHVFPNADNSKTLQNNHYCILGYTVAPPYAPIYGWTVTASYGLLAKESESIYTLATIDANINPNFLLVSAYASRTTTGSTYSFGSFTSSIPQNQIISVNGTTVLEEVSYYPGTTWLSRIMSVYLEGNTVKASFKHSNRAFGGAGGTYTSFPCKDTFVGIWTPDRPSYTSSTWAVNFTIYVGKFTL